MPGTRVRDRPAGQNLVCPQSLGLVDKASGVDQMIGKEPVELRAIAVVDDDEAVDFRVRIQALLHVPGSVLRQPLGVARPVHDQDDAGTAPGAAPPTAAPPRATSAAYTLPPHAAGPRRGKSSAATHRTSSSGLERNRDLFPQPGIERILAHPSIDGRLNELLDYAREPGIPLYVLIDEYENFANTIVAHRGAEAYESFTHGGGFYRSFFAWRDTATTACSTRTWTKRWR